MFVRELPEQVIPARPAAVPLPRSASKAGAAAAKAVAAAAATPAGASLFDAAGTDGDIQVTSDGSRGVSAYNWCVDGALVLSTQPGQTHHGHQPAHTAFVNTGRHACAEYSPSTWPSPCAMQG